MTKIVGLKLAACSKFGNADVGAEADIERDACGARHGSVDAEDKWMVEGAAESEGLVLRRGPEAVVFGLRRCSPDAMEWSLGFAVWRGVTEPAWSRREQRWGQSGPLGERAHRTAVRDGDASSGSTDALGPD